MRHYHSSRTRAEFSRCLGSAAKGVLCPAGQVVSLLSFRVPSYVHCCRLCLRATGPSMQTHVKNGCPTRNAKRVLPWQRQYPAWSLAPALVCTRPSGFLIIIIILLHKNPGDRPSTPPSNHHHLLSFDFAPESQAEPHHSSLLSDASQLPLIHTDRKHPYYFIPFDTTTEGKGCLR